MTDEHATSGNLTSGEMQRATGLGMKALRLYEANGLLVPVHVAPRTGYRTYAAGQVARGRTIALLRRLDLPLARVPEVLDADPRDVRDVLLAWWAERRDVLAAQRSTAERLLRTLAVPDAPDAPGVPGVLGGAGPGSPAETGRVRRREVAERTVATITSRAVQGDLVPTFTADVVTLRAFLADAGVDPGTEFWVVYHEPVGRDVPGRVETCVPYRGAIAPAGDVVLRVDAARSEAYVELTSRECRFPQVVEHHDVLRALAASGTTGTGAAAVGAYDVPTREIYPVPWDDDPDAVVAEIAVPSPSP